MKKKYFQFHYFPAKTVDYNSPKNMSRIYDTEKQLSNMSAWIITITSYLLQTF